MSQTANLLKKITEALKEDSSLIDDMDVVYQFNLKGDYPTTITRKRQLCGRRRSYRSRLYFIYERRAFSSASDR
ncbi:hypothetical protein [Virgibacillus dokdonensis]|uniref:hypothetical protein n=1 Tax=Virgibacillus dokdonensis TaxID=302167 RepID=UPI001C6EA00C|nr:hypothetical protein [Virgibacillus dokdonensis]